MTTIKKPGKFRVLRAGGFTAIIVALIEAMGAAPAAAANWTVQWAYSFVGGSADGANPYAGLFYDPLTGNLVGATSNGGAYGQGTVFTIPTSGGAPTIYSFDGSTDGAGPTGTPVVDGSGNILGTTAYASLSGGTGSGNGGLYKLTPNGSGGYNSISSLYTFQGGTDGANPFAGLSNPDANGDFYGTTSAGGASGDGTVFELKSTGSGNYTYQSPPLYTFKGGSTDGQNAYGGVSYINNGLSNLLYGTTVEGGSADGGTAFTVTPSGTPNFTSLGTNSSEGSFPPTCTGRPG